MKQVKTMTINDTLELMREYGIPICYEKLCALIDAGAVPWAVSGEYDGKHLRMIFRKPLVEWLESLAEVA